MISDEEIRDIEYCYSNKDVFNPSNPIIGNMLILIKAYKEQKAELVKQNEVIEKLRAGLIKVTDLAIQILNGR